MRTGKQLDIKFLYAGLLILGLFFICLAEVLVVSFFFRPKPGLSNPIPSVILSPSLTATPENITPTSVTPTNAGEVNLPSPVSTATGINASPPPPVSYPSWNISTVDPSPKSGVYSSIAIGPADQIAIAYFDDSEDDLKFVELHNETWVIQNLSSTHREGFFSSLSIDPSGNPHIAFFNYDLQVVMYASREGGQWSFKATGAKTGASGISLIIDRKSQPHIAFYDETTQSIIYCTLAGGIWTSNNVAKMDSSGEYFPIGVDAQNRPHILYQDANRGLIYASLEGQAWSEKIVDAGQGIGLFPALAFDPDGNPHASYYDDVKNVLKHAALQGGEWHTEVVDPTAYVGKYSSLGIDPGGGIHISYYDEPHTALKYAYYAGNSRGITRSNSWAITTLDQNDSGQNSSIAVDKEGFAYISYYSHLSRSLKVAYQYQISGSALNLGKVSAFHRSGQTFLTWAEIPNMEAVHYRIYRSNIPINANSLPQAHLLAEIARNSANFYINRTWDTDTSRWHPRYTDRLVIEDNRPPLENGTGLFVWQLTPEDLGGKSQVFGYYAITVVMPNGDEIFPPGAVTGPILEYVGDPLPVEITKSTPTDPGPGGHIYIQYMDFRNWNPTFHAPNPTNQYYGLDPTDPAFAAAVQYAYDYTVYAPTPSMCGGRIPNQLPVVVDFHGWKGNRYVAPANNPTSFCAYTINPIDTSETWYFGFAKYHDYRTWGEVGAGDRIENYTEQRILRMIYDLIRNPPGPTVDLQRIYVYGHSMGGSGALAFAERYPYLFAAAYSGQPITNYRTAGVTHQDWAADAAIKWGSPALNLPVVINAPANWADRLKKYNGIGVWDWQNYQDSLSALRLASRRADDIVPFGIDHGIPDHAILFSTQGRPTYSALGLGQWPWAGIVNLADHEWSQFAGLPPSMMAINGIPFWNLQVRRDETVPGLSNLSGYSPLPPLEPSSYNLTLKWSSSWDAWDGAPIDTAHLYRISLCSITVHSQICGTGQTQTVDITPRRVQQFKTVAYALYDWENRQVSDSMLVASGRVMADKDGLITIPGFEVSPSGNRLVLRPND